MMIFYKHIHIIYAIISLLGVYFIGFFIFKAVLKHIEKIILINSYKLKIKNVATPAAILLTALINIMIIFPTFSISDKVLSHISSLLTILGVFALAWIGIILIFSLRDIFLSYHNIEKKNNLRERRIHTQTKIVVNFLVAGIIIFAFAIALLTLPGAKKIGLSILASAGILSIIIGVAAQKTIGNLLMGLQVALTQPIRIDDVLIIEGEWGRVEEITLTYVVLKIWDRRRMVIPMSYFMEKPFQNWTKTSSEMIGTVFMYVDYIINVDAVREELDKILNASKLWNKEVKVLQVTDVKEKTVELRVLVSADDSSLLWDLRCEVREKLLKFFQKEFPNVLPKIHIDMVK